MNAGDSSKCDELINENLKDQCKMMFGITVNIDVPNEEEDEEDDYENVPEITGEGEPIPVSPDMINEITP